MILRAAAMAVYLLICVTFYYLFRLLRLKNPWPRFFLGGIARIAGVKVRVVGEPATRGAFLLANHVSWMDVPAIAGATGSAFVAHDGLATITPLRILCEMNRTVFIARHDRASVNTQVAQIRDAIGNAHVLTIFPEGTTSDGVGLLPFKSSLLSALDPLPEAIAVQPVLLDYGQETAKIAWIDQEPGVDNFKRILARAKPIELTMHFLPSLSGEALTNRKTMAAAAREAMLQALQRS
jgi:1-acyl-sn-glycerol-3-phosphate acyltransferase